MQETKRIGVAVVVKGEYVLVGVRTAGQVLAGRHEFPGGKCEPGESPEDCTVRECLEETGVPVAILKLLHHTFHDYAHGRVEISFFECRPVTDDTGTLLGNFQWVPRSRLAELTFPEANQPVVELLLMEK